MKSILQYMVLGTSLCIPCTAFVAQIRTPRPSFASPSARYVSSSSRQHVTQNLTTSLALYDEEQDTITTTLQDPNDFFQEYGQGFQQLHDLQTLEKLVESSPSLSESSLTHIEQASTTSSSTLATAQQDENVNANSLFSTVWNARLLLLGAAALYGTNFSLIKVLGDTMPVGISATLRFGFAALATLPWLLSPPKDGSSLISESSDNSSMNVWERLKQVTSTTTVGAALCGFEVGLWNSVGYLAQAVGLETTDASKSAFICSLAVVIVPIIDFLSGKRLLPRQVSGAIMAVAGVGVLEFGGSSLELSSGDVASLLQPIMFGIAFWRMETAMRKYPQEANRSTAAQLLAVFITSALYGIKTCTMDVAQLQSWLLDPMILGSLFFTGIITTALTIYMETVALKTLTAAETTLILSTEPLWGAGFASLLIGEQFGMDAAIGATLIIAGCIFSNLGIDGIMEMVTGKKSVGEEVDEEAVDEEDDHESLTKAAERAILEMGLIGFLTQFVAALEADILIGGASIVAAEEIAEEVTRDLLS